VNDQSESTRRAHGRAEQINGHAVDTAFAESGLDVGPGMDTSAPPVTVKVRVLIERQVGQMTRLVEDLLDVSRFEVATCVCSASGSICVPSRLMLRGPSNSPCNSTITT